MTNDKAIEVLKSECYVLPFLDGDRAALINTALDVAIEALKAQKVGHWIKTPKAVMGEGYMWYCDRCEHQVYQDSSRDYPSENYCPNCGARMEGQK